MEDLLLNDKDIKDFADESDWPKSNKNPEIVPRLGGQGAQLMKKRGFGGNYFLWRSDSGPVGWWDFTVSKPAFL